MKKTLPKKFYKKAAVKEVEAVVVPVKRFQFPNISLPIPESIPALPALPTLPSFPTLPTFSSLPQASALLATYLQSHIFVFSFACGFLIMGIGIVGFDVRMNTQALAQVQIERKEIERQIAYWEGVVREHETYRDGLYQLALLNYRLGDKKLASEYIDKAIIVDPLFEEGKRFMEQLGK